MRLIKLTEVRGTNSNDKASYIERYFNADKIENFRRFSTYDTTYLYMSTISSSFEVVETPEEIIQLIEQAKEI